ncbi:MAG: type IV pilus twitching motility protein PilT [Eubacteriales bacterium]
MEQTIDQLLMDGIEYGASDLHLTVGMPPIYRINGELDRSKNKDILSVTDVKEMLTPLLQGDRMSRLEDRGEVDFSYVIMGVSRFRVNIYYQRRSLCAAIRIIGTKVPTIDELLLPPIMKEIAMKPRGLVLVTGPTGMGKSTTLAAMVNHINENRAAHILTIEDPIEYFHRHKRSMINQREIGDDTRDFAGALRSALREDPDVILVGEMRDLETISTAISAAETGHLVLSTLHTMGAAQTIERIIDVYPPHQQNNVKSQLATVLQAVISQQLIVTSDMKGRALALELLIASDGVRNIVREGKSFQLSTVLQTNLRSGMMSMDYSIAELYKAHKISYEDAVAHCMDISMLKRYMNQI